MMIIHCPLKQDFIIELLSEIKNPFRFTFVKKEGIRLYFKVEPFDIDAAIATAKATIKNTEIGNILYFQITAA